MHHTYTHFATQVYCIRIFAVLFRHIHCALSVPASAYLITHNLLNACLVHGCHHKISGWCDICQWLSSGYLCSIHDFCRYVCRCRTQIKLMRCCSHDADPYANISAAMARHNAKSMELEVLQAPSSPDPALVASTIVHLSRPSVMPPTIHYLP